MTRPIARFVAAVFVLGGGWLTVHWMVETKQIFLILALATVCIVVAYRMAPKVVPPAQVPPDPPVPEGFILTEPPYGLWGSGSEAHRNGHPQQ